MEQLNKLWGNFKNSLRSKKKLIHFLLLSFIRMYRIFFLIFIVCTLFLFSYAPMGKLHEVDIAQGFYVGYILSALLALKAVRRLSNSNRYAFYVSNPKSKNKWLLLYLIPIIILVLLVVFLDTPGNGFNLPFLLIYAPICSIAIAILLICQFIETYEPIKTEPVKENPGYAKIITHSPLFPTFDTRVPSNISHGSASWLTDTKKEQISACSNIDKPFKGLWLGGGFFNHKEGNLVTTAPPGTGKGASLIIPNLLLKRDHKHSFVVFDPKGTNACITAQFQSEDPERKVIIIDPMGLQKLNNARHGIQSSSFNPLDHVEDDLFNNTSQIANLLLPENPKSSDKFWDNEARHFIHTILLHIMTTEKFRADRNLITLQQLVVGADQSALLEEMEKNKSVNGNISLSSRSFIQMAKDGEKMFSSIRSIAGAALKWISNPVLQNVIKKSDFKPSELSSGNVALYICQPIQNKEGFATFSRLIIGSCLKENARPSSSPKQWVYYLLDEFPTMGIFPEVVEALAFSREYKMRLWLFTQSLSQLDYIYTDVGRNQILGSCSIFQGFGVTDQVTQNYMSERIGKTTETTVKETYSEGSSSGSSYGSSTTHGGGNFSTTSNSGNNHSTNTGRSSSIEYKERMLITPSEIEKDPHIITLCEAGPMRLVRWPYFQDGGCFQQQHFYTLFKYRADPNPNFN